MKNKAAYIVTGATGAIGRAIVDGLVRRGCRHIILACRNMDKASAMAEAYDSKQVCIECRELNLESFDSVRRFAEGIKSEGTFIAALINNAGTMPKELIMTGDGYESATQTNFISPVLLTELLLPNICSGGVIVFTTSMTRHIVRLYDDWAERAVKHHQRFTTYGRSKLMLTQYALNLSRNLSPMGIRVNCSDPGVVDSAMITMGNRIVDSLSDKLVRPRISTPEQGAEAALRACFGDDTGKIYTRTGVSDIRDLKWTIPDIKQLVRK